MKKLLTLLSVLTISGTAIPSVIAASYYQKQEKIENKNKRQERNNNENNKINRTKLLLAPMEELDLLGLILNNKVYFGSYEL